MENSEIFPKGIDPEKLDDTTRTMFEKLHKLGSLPPDELQKDIDEFERKQREQGITYEEGEVPSDKTLDEYKNVLNQYFEDNN